MSSTQQKRSMQFGLWPSPVTPQSLAEGIRLSDVAWDSDGETLVWLEGRSDRGVLVCLPAGEEAPRDLTTTLSVRARVGYGGGDFGVSGGWAYFSEAGGRLYRQSLGGGAAEPLTPAFGYAASPAVSPDRRWVVFVHAYEDVDCLAIVDAEGGTWPKKLALGADFYMQPCWHPLGNRIAWVEWNHPQMPWDGTLLKTANVPTGSDGVPRLEDIRTLAGGETTAVFQPAFSPDGRHLAYVSNATGWSNLYLYDLHDDRHRMLTADGADVGQPAWQQGGRTHGFAHDGNALYYVRNEAGFRRLWRHDLQTHTTSEIQGGLETYTYLEQPAVSPTRNALACIASSSTVPARIITLPLAESPQTARVRKRSASESVPEQEFSRPRSVSWPTAGGTTVHGLFYPPSSAHYEGIGLPPAIIYIHGGPTSQAVTSFHPATQFFTTRGYAVLQVNYRGSTGYGRDYTNALNGTWGVYDVEDAVSGAGYLAEKGWVDGGKLVIMGGSAGGYTVLQALVNRAGFFKAGISMYGVSELFALVATTHKFEARYLDRLIGPLPQAAGLYRERSPLFAADAIRDPVAVFQGEIDQVVPKAQSDAIVSSLVSRGVPHVYHVYAGEGHGWRRTDTITHFYGAVEEFLRQHVLFT